jgi:aminoglycoside 6'-N-acetyltransferase I
MHTYRMIDKNNKEEILDYHKMRYNLWPHHEEDELYREMEKILLGKNFYKDELSWTTFVAVCDCGTLCAFIEITLYPELDFTDSKPTAFIEGWYVDSDFRQLGVGKKLVDTAIEWSQGMGCTEIASDVEEDNLVSQRAHLNLGFQAVKEEEGCIFYKKSIC